MNILVLCTGNSARSILLEAILNHDGRVAAFSAGSRPAGKVHPQSLKLLGGLGYDVSQARSKNWDEFGTAEALQMDAVIAVCGSAAAEDCPYWPGAPVRAHWGIEDPAAEPEANWTAAFQTAYDILKRRADALLALPLDGLDAKTLKRELDRIGNLP